MRHTYKATIEIEISEEVMENDTREVNTKEEMDSNIIEVIISSMESSNLEVKGDVTYSDYEIN